MHVEAGELDSALTVYGEALAVDTSDAAVHSNVGYVYTLKKEWPKAIAAYETAAGLSRDAKTLREIQDNLDIVRSLQAGRIRVRHVVVRTEAKARDLLQRIRGGEDFIATARENSIDPSAANGGNIGFFGKGDLDSAFEAVAFALKVGEVSGVVKTSLGYHIIKRID